MQVMFKIRGTKQLQLTFSWGDSVRVRMGQTGEQVLF